MNSGKIVADGWTDEGSIRGPRRPKNNKIKDKETKRQEDIVPTSIILQVVMGTLYFHLIKTLEDKKTKKKKRQRDKKTNGHRAFIHHTASCDGNSGFSFDKDT